MLMWNPIKTGLGRTFFLCAALTAGASSPGCATAPPAATGEGAGTEKAEIATARQLYDAGRFGEALEALLPLARQGDPQAQYAVGYLYFYGRGTTADQAAGVEWIRKAASQNHPKAIEALSLIATHNVTRAAGDVPTTARVPPPRPGYR